MKGLALVKRTEQLICKRMKMFTVVFHIGQTGIRYELENMNVRIQRGGGGCDSGS